MKENSTKVSNDLHNNIRKSTRTSNRIHNTIPGEVRTIVERHLKYNEERGWECQHNLEILDEIIRDLKLYQSTLPTLGDLLDMWHHKEL